MSKTLVDHAADFAYNMHMGQKRKYTGHPYWTHCAAVASQVERWGGTEEMIAAAWLHDTIEDTDTTLDQIANTFGNAVALFVIWLTDVYTPEQYPAYNRATRKHLEADRLRKAPLEVKVIKLADIANNTKDVVQNDPKFAKVYFEEKAYLLSCIGDALDKWREHAKRQS